MSRRRGPTGVTLIEMLVVLAMLGVLMLVSAPGCRARTAPSTSEAETLRMARLRALETGRPVQARNAANGRVLLFMPDGSVVGQGLRPSEWRTDAATE